MPSSPSSSSSDSEELSSTSLFTEPSDYYQPPKPFTYTSYTLKNGSTLNLRLVGQSSLWGHLLWNAGRVAAEYLQDHAARLVVGRDVLEFGAGAGLPGLVAATCGARSVTLTDYPDSSLIENLSYNATHALPASASASASPTAAPITVAGYKWGPTPLPLPPHPQEQEKSRPRPRSYALVILADLLFNHPAHAALASSLALHLARTPEARALVFFTPYRPWLLDKDLAFLKLLQEERGEFVVEDMGIVEMGEVMFEGDRGDEKVRRTVYRFEVRWREGELE